MPSTAGLPQGESLLRTLAAVAETTASLVIITDADDRIEWVNPSFTRVTGWTLEAVAGRTPRAVLNGSDTELSPDWLRAHHERTGGAGVDAVEIKLYRRDGTPYWALVEVRPMHDADGRLTHHLHLHTDVTARRVAERRAQESQRWLQLASSVFGLGLWHTSLADGVMVWDATLKRMFGLPATAATPSFDELIERYVVADDRALVRRGARQVPAPGTHAEVEYRVQRADGQVATMVSRFACVDYDDDGEPRRILGAVLDVTETRTTTRRLRDALRRLRLAAEASRIGAWERDLLTDEGQWDPTMFTLLGHLPAERAPSHDETLAMVHPDDRAAVEAAWQRMVEEQRPVEYEHRVLRPDGDIVHIITRGLVERDAAGQPLRALGTVIDVTALRRAERDRDELTRRIELVAEAIGLGLWEYEPGTGQSRWNDMMYTLYGRTREALRDRMWLDVVHPDDVERARSAFAQTLRATEPFELEFRVVHPDGSVRWLASRGRGEADGAGGVRRVMGVNWDITERVRMEQSALAAERTALDLLERMLLVTSATGLGVWEFDVATQALRWDAQMYALFGCEPGRNTPEAMWREAVHADDQPRVAALLRAAVEHGERFETEFRVERCDGSSVWLAARAVLREGPAGRVLLGVNWDITERRMAESALRAKETAERASAAKTEFLSRMSHELRTPLNAILGFTQLMELDHRHPLPAENRERVQHIRQAGWHLLTLINEVLDLSRIEAGAARIELVSVPLAAVIDECVALLAGEAARRRIGVSVRHMAGAPAALQADRTRLKQVLLNLLSNAVKYNREGGRIEIVARTVEPGWGEVAVRDGGIGISAEKMDALFQPFNRLGLESAPIEGTGIGLTIALKLAEQMGGRLEASSEPGIGSEFTGHRRSARRAAAVRRCHTDHAQRYRRQRAVRRGQRGERAAGAAADAAAAQRHAVHGARCSQCADAGAGVPARSHRARPASARR
ncbi:MAG: PAS domain-containing protein, partial [Burkholderiaceae bacterium]|nr:PAS domain-containing protein [Burkholderiaceae bacterium]